MIEFKHMERYPENIRVTLEDFKKCGWSEIIREVRRKDYSSIWQALSSAASQAIKEDRLSEGKVLWLLADACSMELKPSSRNEPFKPTIVMDGKRTALPEDFQPDDITFFTEIATEITDPKLCARISDITWLLKKPRDPSFALLAIDNYCQISISTDSWIKDGYECWERAIQLCKMLKAGSGERLEKIEINLVQSLQNATIEDSGLAWQIADLLAKHKLSKREDQIIVSEKLEKLGIEFDSAGDLNQSERYFDAAAYWYREVLKNLEKFAEMIVKVAEELVKRATIAKSTSDPPDYFAAQHFYECAISKYRTIPKSLRTTHSIDSKISKLQTEMNSAIEQYCLTGMSIISSDPINLSKFIEDTKKAISGKNIDEALLKLANIYLGKKVTEIRDFAEKILKEYPLQARLPVTYISEDGRVIAKRPGIDPKSANNEETVWEKMVHYYTMDLHLIVQAFIWPALEVMRQEHRLKEASNSRPIKKYIKLNKLKKWVSQRKIYYAQKITPNSRQKPIKIQKNLIITGFIKKCQKRIWKNRRTPHWKSNF